MSDPDHSAEDDGKLDAAEYVLGVLGVAQRREIERRLPREPELAREVAAWEERLGGLADKVPPATPPDTTWSRIERAIGGQTSARSASAATVGVPEPRPTLWEQLVFWRRFAAAATACAVVFLGATAYLALAPSPRTSPLLAMLGQTSGQPGFVAAVGSDGRSLTIVPAALLAQDQRSLELWLIPSGDKPHSLGLIAAGQPVRINIPADLAGSITADTTLAVSLEPLGGSPTGQPTGPVIAQGKLTSL